MRPALRPLGALLALLPAALPAAESAQPLSVEKMWDWLQRYAPAGAR